MMKNDGEHHLFVDNLYYGGATLGARRLNMLKGGLELYPLKLAIYSLGELLKVATPTQWFIDSKGEMFTYEKTHYVPVVYKEITNCYFSGPFELMIETKDSPPLYKTLYQPAEGEKYAVFLQISPKALLFYGYSDTKHENKRKKI